MAVRVPVQCENCGKVDDHPKHHYGNLTFHFDCTPHFVIEDMTSVSDWVWDDNAKTRVLRRRDPIPEDALHPQVKHFLAVREAALGGLHGNDLLAHIGALHEDMAPHEDTAGHEDHAAAVAAITEAQEAAR